MADISVLSRLVNGSQRNVDLTANTPVVLSIKVGGVTNTELTKAILDKLILIHTAADADGTFDTRYTQIADLASAGPGEGASLVGINDLNNNFTATHVEGALEELFGAIGSRSAADISFSNIASGLTATNVQTAIDEVEGRLDTAESAIAGKISSSEKGAANGVATLDASQLIPITQLPPAALERLVIVADQTARFALTTATVQDGDTVKQTDTGVMYFVKDDTNLGNAAGYEVYTAGTASSVAWSGVTGTPTTLAGYGITDGYTDADAKAAAVADSISDSVTDIAPSQNAVFDALALKQDASANLDEADTFFGSTDLSAAEAETLSDGSNADALHAHASLKKVMVAGESFAANTSFLVRMAVNGETAGRVYKADNDATSSDNFYVIGIAHSTSAVSAAGNITVALFGSYTLGSVDSVFAGADIGKPVFLTAAGAFSTTSPSSVNQAVVRIGMVQSTTAILSTGIQVIGVL